MAWESKTIAKVLRQLNDEFFLPAIQREFEWDTGRIEKLFDSIMCEYPIGSLLVWKIPRENIEDWSIYEFIKNYDAEKPHNTETNLSSINKDISLVLDGQQRLTSLYIGLKGTYKYFYYRWRKTKLYLNLVKAPTNNDDTDELKYQFLFRETDETDSPATEYWYEVGKILSFNRAVEAKNDIKPYIKDYSETIRNNVDEIIDNFFHLIHTKENINYFEEESNDNDKVVEIFIRANTGGKQLSYSDILLSTATAKWQNYNAREEIQNFTDEINRIKNGYAFGKDFVLKGSLYLTSDLPIQYKVKNFTKQNLEKIENNWDNIQKYIEDTIKLISKFGFSSNNIVSSGALLPIAYYLKKLSKKYFINSTEKDDIKNQVVIQKWLILALVKNAFGGSSDSTLKNVRDVINEQDSFELFPYEAINKKLNLESGFSETELENIFNVTYKSRYSFLILSLLYPNRDWKDMEYQEDHIYPKTEFTKAKLKNRGFNLDKIEEYLRYYNTVLNLQLLTKEENLDKKAKDFAEWIETRDRGFKNRHIIPEIEDYNFDCFIKFIDARRELIKTKLQKISL